MFNISLDAFRTTDQVITKLSNEVAYLKTKEFDIEQRFEKIKNSDHLSVKSRILFLLAINDTLSFSNIKKHIKSSASWLKKVLETLLKNEVIGFTDNDAYYLKI